MSDANKTAGTHIVIVVIDSGAEDMPILVRHAQAGLKAFPGYAGFISGNLHVSRDSTRLFQMVKWETADLYDECISSPDWNDLPSTVDFFQILNSGRATMTVWVCDGVPIDLDEE